MDQRPFRPGGQRPMAPNQPGQQGSPQFPQAHNPYSMRPQPAMPPLQADGPGRKSNRGKWLLAAGCGLLVVAGVSSYVFGLYLPNKPENVWKTGMDRSAMALDALVTEMSSQDTKQAYEKVKIDGSISFESGDAKAGGTISGKMDKTTMDGSMSINYDDGASQAVKLGLDWRTKLEAGKTYPDSYFRLSGLKALGLDTLIPELGQYDEKWISVSGDYLKSIAPLPDQLPDDTAETPTQEEMTAMVKAMADVTKEYVFTNDPAKAVIVNKQFVAKETSEGVEAYHYKAGVNQDNAKAYCEALVDAVAKTDVYKKLASGSADNAQSLKQECDEGAKEASHNPDTFDLWVTAKQKIIQKVRIENPDQKGEYFELGHAFDGGDSIPQFFRAHADGVTIEQQASYNRKSRELSMSVDVTNEKATEEMAAFDFTVSLSLVPHNEEVRFEKPADSVPLKTIFEGFGFDPALLADPGMTGGGGQQGYEVLEQEG